jgi:hypothetical protein
MLSAYRTLAAAVTESRFDDLAVIANWNPNSSFPVDGHTIAPSGCLARTGDGTLVAGVFVDQFNGGALSGGLHYLLIERGGPVITVRQPSGNDTILTVALPPDWDLASGVQVRAIARDDQSIGDTLAALDGDRVMFLYARTVANVAVDRYEVTLAKP